MRITRSWQRFKARRSHSGNKITAETQRDSRSRISSCHVFLFSSILLGLACLAFAGYWLERRANPSKVAAVSVAKPAADSQSISNIQNTSKLQDWEAPADWRNQMKLAVLDVENSSKKIQLHLQKQLITALQGELAARTKADSLSNTVLSLRARIKTLTEQRIALESELQKREIELAEAESQLQNGNLEHRVIYNITNIPLGSYVSEAELQKSDNSSQGSEAEDPLQADSLLNDITGSMAGDDLPGKAVGLAEAQDDMVNDGGLSVIDDQPMPEFGPAPDRVENTDFSGTPNTPYQE